MRCQKIIIKRFKSKYFVIEKCFLKSGVGCYYVFKELKRFQEVYLPIVTSWIFLILLIAGLPGVLGDISDCEAGGHIEWHGGGDKLMDSESSAGDGGQESHDN